MLPTTFTVLNTTDSGAGSLRQAIIDSNASTTATNTIDFAIGATGTSQAISPLTPLPSVTQSVVIDGWSQGGAGYTGVPLVTIDGATGTIATGLNMTTSAPGSTVRGLVINDDQTAGIILLGDFDKVQACYVGTNPTGTAAGSTHATFGIEVSGNDQTIGTDSDGTNDAAEGNLISGNATGVAISDPTTFAVVAGNKVGTDAAGMAAIPNTGTGISITSTGVSASTNNTIGGTTAVARNVISGNTRAGVDLSGVNTTGTVVEGNYIGTNVLGNAVVANGIYGIYVELGASNNTIGGLTSGARNVISGNTPYEVDLNTQSSNTTVEGNYIGTTPDGSAALGNEYGILISASTNNLIGGTLTGSTNVISGNLIGVLVEGFAANFVFLAAQPAPTATANNLIEGNLIGLNALGNASLGNTSNGIFLDNEVNTTIGGSALGAGNVISGTIAGSSIPSYYPATVAGAGVFVGVSAHDDLIEENKIGTDINGTVAIPNAGAGIAVYLNNTAVTGNQIAGNTNAGVYVYGDAVDGSNRGVWTGDDTVFSGIVTVPGTLTSGAGYAPGLSGDAFSFDGVSGALQDTGVGNGRLRYSLNGTAGTTYSGWVKTTDTDGTLMTDGGGVDTAFGTGLFVTGGKLTLIGSKGTAGQFNFTVTGPTINDGQWHQFAYTWTGDNTPNGVQLYMDGVVVAQGTAQVSLTAFTNQLSFGGDPDFPTLPYLNGLLDEVSVYNSELSPSAIATIYSLRAAGQTSQGATIASNLIGTNALGTLAIANAGGGVVVDSSLSTLIGGTTVAARNQISGNTGDGVMITGAESMGDIVEGNYIGVTASGSAALPNAVGIEITTGASAAMIGGLTSTPGTGEGNLISGNANEGVFLDISAVSNTVEGNLIGTNANGTAAIPNFFGVAIDGSSNNVIGGTVNGSANVISGDVFGLWVVSGVSSTSANNVIEGNLIGLNALGAAAIGNTFVGVYLSGDLNTTVGGTLAGSQNVISGTTAASAGPFTPAILAGSGVIVADRSHGDVVDGNKIGTDPTGSFAIPNAADGVAVYYGGATVTANQISGNASAGVYIYGDAVDSTNFGVWTGDDTVFDDRLVNPGSLTLGASYAPGLSGDAFSFDGVSGAFQDTALGNRRVFYGSNGRIAGTTFSGWVKTTDTDGTLMSDGGGVDTTNGSGLFVMGGKLTLIGSKGTAGQFNFTVIGPTINDGQWHQFAYTWTDDTTANGVKLFLDGVHVGQGTALASMPGAANMLDFGGDPSFPTLPYLNGLLDEVSVYNSALSPSAIATIFSLKAAGQTSQGATVSGNLIGTNALGTAAIANQGDGVVVDSSLSTIIGGTTVAARNLISGNTGTGVTITGAESMGVLVEGNYIGTTANGTTGAPGTPATVSTRRLAVPR